MSNKGTVDRETGFIRHMFDLADREDRGALAELRRSLVSGNEALAARHVFPCLGAEVGPRRESAALLVAGLFALHPKRATQRNFGHTMSRVWQAQDKRPSMEQRFVQLLDAHYDDLAYYLRQAVSLARSEDVPIDWQQLYNDICNWTHPERYVQRNWARAFWGGSSEERNQPSREEE